MHGELAFLEPFKSFVADSTCVNGALGEGSTQPLSRFAPLIIPSDEEDGEIKPPTMWEAATVILDTSLSTKRRLEVYKEWDNHDGALRQVWTAQGKPPCPQCTKPHHGDCLRKAGDFDRLCALRKEGQMLLEMSSGVTQHETATKKNDKKSQHSKANKKTESEAKVKAQEKVKAKEKEKERAKLKKAYFVPPCPSCARPHKSVCLTRRCKRCGRGHDFKETCDVAKKRFQEAGLIQPDQGADDEVANLVCLASKVESPEVLERLAGIIDRAAGGDTRPEGSPADSISKLIYLARKMRTPEGLDRVAAQINHSTHEATRKEKRKVDADYETGSEKPKKTVRFSMDA